MPDLLIHLPVVEVTFILFHWDFSEKFDIDGSSVLYCSSAVTFDPAILTLLIGQRTGARVIMTSPDTTVDVMLETLVSEGVTHIQVSGYIIFVDSFK